MPIRSSPDSPADRSVREEWLAGLPEDKQRAFQSVVTQLEAGYAMFSIAANEAVALRRSGSLVRAREQVATTASVMSRFADHLARLLSAILAQAAESGQFPQVAPLNPSFFRWPVGRRMAAWESLLDLVVRSRNFRFRRKLRALARLVDHLSGEFRHAAHEISEGSSVHPESHWEALDWIHYDLNTCLRETIVVLKSFLLGLEPPALEDFQRRLESPITGNPDHGAGFSHLSA